MHCQAYDYYYDSTRNSFLANRSKLFTTATLRGNCQKTTKTPLYASIFNTAIPTTDTAPAIPSSAALLLPHDNAATEYPAGGARGHCSEGAMQDISSVELHGILHRGS